MTRWTTSDIPPQQGRLAVITGTGGIGFEDALALTRAGADVVLAGRNPERRSRGRGGPINRTEGESLDLASLASVGAFAERMRAERRGLDLLINNAAVTELIPNGAGRRSPMGVVRQVLGPVLFQSPAQGALPALFAATAPDAEAGGYYGPRGFNETRGAPAVAKMPPQTEDVLGTSWLWDASERMSGVAFV